MSCRVLKRGMENFTLNTIVEVAKTNGFKFIKGEYIPTAKNNMVKDHYKSLGFDSNEKGEWNIDIQSFQNRENHIIKK